MTARIMIAILASAGSLFSAQNEIFQSGPVPALLPWPQDIAFSQGRMPYGTKAFDMTLALPDTQHLGKPLSDIQRLLRPKVHKATSAKIYLRIGLPDRDATFQALCQQRSLWPDDRIGEEGYVLEVSQDAVLLAAKTTRGIFYGLQTLLQLLRDPTAQGSLPLLKIVDWPNFRYRGMQDDISRGPIPTLEFMKTQVRRCAEIKLNMLSYYTEHVVATTRQPWFAPARAAITIAEWAELSEYASQHFVELVPNFQSFGHFEKILRNPRYQHLGEAGRLLSPAFEESYQFLDDIYSEMAPAFRSSFFNVNCDETWDLGRGASKTLVDSIGVARVYLKHMLRLSKLISRQDKRMMMWSDVVLKHPEILAKFPPKTVMLTWEYSAFDNFDHMIQPIKGAGYDFFVVPGVLNSNRIMPDFNSTRINIRNFARDGRKHGAMGMLNTVWDDGGSALFARDWLGVAYGAEQSWRADGKADGSFDDRFAATVYADGTPAIPKAIAKLNGLGLLMPTQDMKEAVFWESVIPDRDASKQLNLQDWQAVLDICDSAQAALDKASPRRNGDELAVWQLTIEQYRLAANLRLQLMRAANAYREAIFLQRDERAAAQAKLQEAGTVLQELLSQSRALRDQFAENWLRESKSYWLDRLLARLDRRISSLNHAHQLIASAQSDFAAERVLPPPSTVRLDISAAESGYFQYWLVVGPFPNADRKQYAFDFLAALGGESRARGQVAGEFLFGEKTFRWQKVQFPDFAVCDLKKVLSPGELVIAYAYARIETLRDETVKATFGSNDGIRIILNGERVFAKHEKRNLMLDEDQVMLPLRKGYNHLLLKIDQQKGDWGFSFRLPDHVVRHHKHKYRIIR